MNTNSLLNESAGFNKKMSEEAKGLVAKWEKTGLLEGVDAEFPGFETGAGKDSQTDSVFGITEVAGDASEGLYGAGRFGYTINDAASATQSLAAATATDAYSTASLAFSDINYDSAFSASTWATHDSDLVTVAIETASLAQSGEVADFDSEGIRAFALDGVDEYFAAYTRLAGGNIVFVARDTAFGDTLVVKYQKQPTDITRGDFEATGLGNNPETDLGIPELNVELRSVPIVAKTRKLKAQWTPEFAQDLNAYHSIDAEAELTSMLSEYVSQEIDLEILDMLMTNALTEGHWSAKVGFEWNGSNGFVDGGTAARYTQQQWFQTLGTVLQRVSNQIHAKTMRGGANFMVVSPDVATILESIPGFAANGTGDAMQFAMGVSQVGSFANRYQVYKNPYMTDNVILMGFKGAQFLETGAVYAPYIPLIMTPLVYDPKNFTPRKGVMTRYAKQMVRGEFYGKVYVGDLNTLG